MNIVNRADAGHHHRRGDDRRKRRGKSQAEPPQTGSDQDGSHRGGDDGDAGALRGRRAVGGTRVRFGQGVALEQRVQ